MLRRMICVLTLCTLSLPGLAQEGGSNTDRFQAATAAAESAYSAGNYQLAVERYMDAYEVIPSADIIYNVAYIYEKHIGNLDLARVHYERVLRDPSAAADLVRKSSERIAALDRAAAARAQSVPRLGEGVAEPVQPVAPPPAAVTPAPSTTSTTTVPRRSSAAPWVLTGAGGALVVGGVAAGLVARGTNQDFLAGQGGVEGMRELADQGQQQAIVADALWVTGAVTAVVGLGWGISTSVRTRAGTVQLDVLPAPGSLNLAGRF